MDEQKLAESAKPGDLIEVSRGLYKHWGVYIGDGEIVHLTLPNNGMGVSNSVSHSSGVSSGSSRAIVKRDKMGKVTDGDHFKVTNHLDDKYQPRERDTIMKDAISLVGEEVPYSLTSQNCEHFVTKLRYGRPESKQVQDVAIKGVVLAGVGAIGAGIAGAGIIGAGAVGAGIAGACSAAVMRLSLVQFYSSSR